MSEMGVVFCRILSISINTTAAKRQNRSLFDKSMKFGIQVPFDELIKIKKGTHENHHGNGPPSLILLFCKTGLKIGRNENLMSPYMFF